MADFKPLRIAVLSIHSSPTGPLGTRNTGGMSVYIREVARWLGQSGHCVDIYTYIPSDKELVDLYPNVQVIHLNPPWGEEIPKEAMLDHLPVIAERLDQFVRTHQFKYDLIHSHYWLSTVLGSKIQKRWQCPHVTMFHTLGLIKNLTTAGESEPQARIRNEREQMEAVNAIIVPTEEEKTNVLKHYGAYPEKVRVIPCGVNLDHFSPVGRPYARKRLKIDPACPALLFVGRYAPVKGVDCLLDAIAQLAGRFPKLNLLVVGGDGPQARSTLDLMHRIESLGVQPFVTVVGRVDHDLLPLYYSAADVTVLPSSYESFGLVTLESLACGTPVAATGTGAAKSIIAEGINGAIIDRTDGAAIAKAIQRLLVNGQERPVSASLIRESVSEFKWEDIAASVLRVYNALLEALKSKRD